MYGKIGHISRGCHKIIQNSSRGHGHATNLVENQATEPEILPNNKYMLFPVKSQAPTPPWRTARLQVESLSQSLEGILEQNKELFQQGPGMIKGI